MPSEILPRTFERRFWSKVQKSEGCWLWTGYIANDGYGQTSVGGKTLRAHRVALMLDGVELAGQLVCHRCDTPLCVRPSHLFLGSPLDNSRDRDSKNRHAHGETSTSNLTEDEVRRFLSRYYADEKFAELLSAFNVSETTAFRIINGESWGHLGLARGKRPRKVTSECVCGTCGKTFEALNRSIRRGSGKYCSPACWYGRNR